MGTLENLAKILFIPLAITLLFYLRGISKIFSYMDQKYPHVLKKYHLRDISYTKLWMNPVKQIRFIPMTFNLIFTSRLKFDSTMSRYISRMRISFYLFIAIFLLIIFLLIIGTF